jgi:succinyl-CoA synthetase beta subunit/citryl-CoA synthetase large subunit
VGRILEHHAKELLARHGIAVPAGREAATPDAAAAAAAALGGRVVVKALVPSNRRAKAGAVRFADDAAAAAREAAALLGTTVAGHEVHAVLVEERLDLERELFFSVLVDRDRRVPVALASAGGGVEVEETASRSPDALRSATLDPRRRTPTHRLRELWASAGVGGPELVAATTLAHRATACFFASDATILEVNPLALVRGTDATIRPVAVGVVLDVDDQALPRQPQLAPLVAAPGDRVRPSTELERQAVAVAAAEPYRGTARFLELEGDIGLLVGGGGGSLALFEAVRRAGGRPACHTELGGNPSAEKVRGLARVVLSCPGVRGLLVAHNITNNTQVDLVAAGVVAALEDRGLDPAEFPVVARELGTHDREGRAIFERAGIEYLGEEASLEDAARRIVERVRGGGAA